ncbi:MAG: pyroglutamyl-peptidase [Bacillota bacterium]|nr:MAG: pyroglutamyl-peptidase [Bacillota bacterium]
MRTLLLTGFEPFGGEKTNPSLEAVKQLDGLTFGDIAVKAIELPVSWDRVIPLIHSAIATHTPDFIISVGQAGGRAKIAVERIGINICYGQDNYDVTQNGEPIVPSGPDGYFSSLPVVSLAAAISAAGVPAYVSNTAGTYLCNYALYTLEHHIRTHNLPIQSCFIHIPFLPEQTTDKPNQLLPSMSLDSIVSALRAAIQAMAVPTAETAQVDATVAGAVTH